MARREIKVYEKRDVQAIVKAMDPWWRLLVVMAAETGCRWAELQGVTVGDFSLDYRKVTVRRTVVETHAARTTGQRFA